MIEFLTGKDEGGNTLFLIEWDRNKGVISIQESDAGSHQRVGQDDVYGWADIKIIHGIQGQDEVHFNGQHLMIKKSTHNVFTEEFPTTDLEGEYLKADAWCEKNKEKRHMKNHAAFMLNWLKRSRGGNMSRGGVVY
jgi:hypothetical protein